MLRYLLIVWPLITVLCTWTSAQVIYPQKPDKWEFSVFYGMSHGTDREMATPVADGSSQAVGFHLATGYVVGARITENLGTRFGAELDYNMSNHPLLFSNLSPSIQRVDVDQRVHNITYAILFYPLKWQPSSKLRPYVEAGPGASFYQVYGSSAQDAAQKGVDLLNRWKFSAAYGGGVKYSVQPHWGFRADVRDIVTGVPDYGLPPVAPTVVGTRGPGFRPDGVLHNWQVLIGFYYGFNVR